VALGPSMTRIPISALLVFWRCGMWVAGTSRSSLADVLGASILRAARTGRVLPVVGTGDADCGMRV
jgi:hypothetical protein